MHVVLVHPEIAPNTGNIIRLCANTGSHLHLIEPLGFDLDAKLLRRAGLDYHEMADVTVHADLGQAERALPGRWFGFSSAAHHGYCDVSYRDDDVLVFGAERAGLAPQVADRFDPERFLRIPMLPDNRSLNLANAVAVVVYEAWRQRGFAQSAPPTEARSSGVSESLRSPPFDS